MTSRYKKDKRFDKVELEWAISLMEKEYEKPNRNTPEKMAKLIAENFDVVCDEFQIYSFFGLVENYELESKKIECG